MQYVNMQRYSLKKSYCFLSSISSLKRRNITAYSNNFYYSLFQHHAQFLPFFPFFFFVFVFVSFERHTHREAQLCQFTSQMTLWGWKPGARNSNQASHICVWRTNSSSVAAGLLWSELTGGFSWESNSDILIMVVGDLGHVLTARPKSCH